MKLQQVESLFLMSSRWPRAKQQWIWLFYWFRSGILLCRYERGIKWSFQFPQERVQHLQTQFILNWRDETQVLCRAGAKLCVSYSTCLIIMANSEAIRCSSPGCSIIWLCCNKKHKTHSSCAPRTASAGCSLAPLIHMLKCPQCKWTKLLLVSEWPHLKVWAWSLQSEPPPGCIPLPVHCVQL